MTSFRKIVPNSTVNAVNQKYEYYLVWLAPSGALRSWLFSHTEGEENEVFELFSIEGLTDIRSVPLENRKEVTARTVSLSSEQYDYVKSIMASNRVYQVTKDNQQIPIALKSADVSRSNKNKEFNFTVNFMFKELDILNV